MSRTHAHVPFSVYEKRRGLSSGPKKSPFSKLLTSNVEFALPTTYSEEISKAVDYLESIGFDVETTEKDCYFHSMAYLSKKVQKHGDLEFNPALRTLLACKNDNGLHPGLKDLKSFHGFLLPQSRGKFNFDSFSLRFDPPKKSQVGPRHNELSEIFGIALDTDLTKSNSELADLRKNLINVTLISGSKETEKSIYHYTWDWNDWSGGRYRYDYANGERKETHRNLHAAALAFNSGENLENLEEIDVATYNKLSGASNFDW